MARTMSKNVELLSSELVFLMGCFDWGIFLGWLGVLCHSLRFYLLSGEVMASLDLVWKEVVPWHRDS